MGDIPSGFRFSDHAVGGGLHEVDHSQSLLLINWHTRLLATIDRVNRLWHYPGSVDTVSKVMNIQVSKPTNRWESDIGCGAVGMSRRS